MTPSRALVGLGLCTVAVAALIGGLVGVAYLGLFVAATLPGWPIGRRLFGRRTCAAAVAGGLIGYGLTAVALWVPIAMQVASWPAFVVAWVTASAASFMLCRPGREPMVPLPAWTSETTTALVFVLALVPALIVLPYRHVGQIDDQGGRRYRAYFTADFVWHEALTAELARFDSPPRNPYMASEPLHYYWGYFILPASVTGSVAAKRDSTPIEPLLAVNALGAGMLFVGAIFLAAWAAWPRTWAVAGGVALVLLAASAEGLYELVDLTRRGLPLGQLRGLNIDAITAWFFYGLTIDGLPRSLWWGPQHATASALGLVALTIAARMGREMTVGAAMAAGTALGLALLMSPFPAGTMTLTYGLAVLWDGLLHPRDLVRIVITQSVAVAMVGLGLLWCLYNGTFEGAGGAIAFGLSRAAIRTPLTILALALGPVLIATAIGVVIVAWQRFPRAVRPPLVGITAAGMLFFFVTLVLEPIWIGWRAGHHFLVTAPAVIAAALSAVHERLGRIAAIALATCLLLAGLPTTIIDVYNAQDTTNLALGPGFRWTVLLTPGEQEALRWVETHTPPRALVQMSLNPRGRETWSLIPSFARRRMAAGLPISLLRTPEYEALAARADTIYSSADGAAAAAIAHELKIDYIYVGAVERDAFGASIDKFTNRPDLFGRVFANDTAAVYAVY